MRRQGLVAASVAACAVGLAACSGPSTSATAGTTGPASAGAATTSTSPPTVSTFPPVSTTTAAPATTTTTTPHPTTTTTTAPHPTTTTTAPQPTTTTTTAPHPTTTTAPHSTTTTSPPPVLAGFVPTSFTAISASTYWVLGSTPCHGARCAAVARTTDGGQHFVAVPAPTAPLTSAGATTSPPTAIDTLRFATKLDGFAYGTRPGSVLWVTHDGGKRWRASTLHGLLGFAAGGGYAYALTGSCAKGECTKLSLQRSPVHRDVWKRLSVPVTTVAPVVAMTVHAASVWASVSTAGSGHPHQTLLASTDRGRHMSAGASPCATGLGGEFTAASASALWAVCPTGTEAAAYRSIDAGGSWTLLTTPTLANTALVAPASAKVAELSPGTGSLLRTTDGGSTFTPVQVPGTAGGHWTFLGFTTASTGAGLLAPAVPSGSQAAPPGVGDTTPAATATAAALQLWRTTDGGAAWKGPVAVGGS